MTVAAKCELNLVGSEGFEPSTCGLKDWGSARIAARLQAVAQQSFNTGQRCRL